jgi:O-antigen/teichoic acid export membrane protein
VPSGFAVALVSRGIRVIIPLVLARAIILQFGPSRWGVLALSLAIGDLILMFDFAIHELCVYQAAASRSRRGVQEGLDQAVVLAALPVAVGVFVLLGCALCAARGIGFADDYAGPQLMQLFLAAAAAWPFTVVGNVYSGTLQGFGWIRELNYVALFWVAVDLVALLVALDLGFGIVGVQWLRFAAAPARLLALLFALRRLGLPVGRPRRPDRSRLGGLLRYAAGYNANRGLETVVHSCNPPLAQLFVPATALGAFSAADEWANKLYRATGVTWESLFHRLVRCFREGATEKDRETGRIQFLAVSLGITLLLVPVGVLLILVSPWLFRAWLDADNAVRPVMLLPGIVLAWALNATANPSTCAIMAANRFRVSTGIHLTVVIVNVALAVVGAKWFGMPGVVGAMVAANGLLVALLSAAACRMTGASWWRFLRSNGAVYLAGLVAVAWHWHARATWATAAAGALVITASLVVGYKARSLRSMRELLASAEPERVR